MPVARNTVPSYNRKTCATISSLSEWINTSFPCALKDLPECFLDLDKAMLEMLVSCEMHSIPSCSFPLFEVF